MEKIQIDDEWSKNIGSDGDGSGAGNRESRCRGIDAGNAARCFRAACVPDKKGSGLIGADCTRVDRVGYESGWGVHVRCAGALAEKANLWPAID